MAKRIRHYNGIRLHRIVCLFLLLMGGIGSIGSGPAPSSFVGNTNSKTYHREDCGAVRRMSQRNRVAFTSYPQAEAQGFQACRTCKPNQPASSEDDTEPTMPPAGPTPVRFASTAQGQALSFSKQIAPILVANCLECHNPERKRGGLDMSSFQKLMAGGENGPVIEPTKPDESELILRVAGESTPKMPPGNNRNLADATIESISQWIKSGALLDSGVDADAALAEIASTPEELRRQALEKMTPEQRNGLVDQAAIERWRQVLPDGKPERVDGEKVSVFSNLPKERAERLARTLDKAVASLAGLLSRPGKPVLAGPQKLSIYVFKDRPAFAEFVRTVLRQEVDENSEARGDLKAETPFLAVLDPLGGRDGMAPEVGAPPATKKLGRGASAPDQALEAAAVERLSFEAVSNAGNPPRWLALGLGKYLAAKLEPRGPRPAQHRAIVATQFQLGWMTKSQDALGDQGDEATIGSMGFSLIEFLNSGPTKGQFPALVRGLLDGGTKLDEGLMQLFGANRQDFLTNWGQFVASRYGRGR